MPWKLLYADDLVVNSNSQEDCIAKLKAWKENMEQIGLRVNVNKTKVMVSGFGLNVLKDSGKCPL
jgi:hypothetical protein